MAKDYSKAIAATAAYHKEVEKAFEAGRAQERYDDYYTADVSAYPKLIVQYIFDNGGAVDPAVMRKALEGKVARTSQDDPSYSDMLAFCKKGRDGHELERAIRAAGGFFDPYAGMGYADRQKVIDAQKLNPAVFEHAGKLYLWVHKKNDQFCMDLAARYGGNVQTAINRCEAAIKAAEDAPAIAKELESLIKEKTAERESLGLFKGKRGKELKAQIAEAEGKLSNAKSLVQKASEAKSELNAIYSALDQF